MTAVVARSRDRKRVVVRVRAKLQTIDKVVEDLVGVLDQACMLSAVRCERHGPARGFNGVVAYLAPNLVGVHDVHDAIDRVIGHVEELLRARGYEVEIE